MFLEGRYESEYVNTNYKLGVKISVLWEKLNIAYSSIISTENSDSNSQEKQEEISKKIFNVFLFFWTNYIIDKENPTYKFGFNFHL